MHKQMLTPTHTFKNATTTQKTHINIYVYNIFLMKNGSTHMQSNNI